MKIIAIMMCLLGCILIYCSHPHQNVFRQSLSKFYALIGLSCLIFSIVLFFICVPKLVAIYMWVMILVATWSLLPFIPLFKKNILNEISHSTKNST